MVVVDDTLARLYWPDSDPLGSHLLIDDAGGAAPREVEIVRVAGNVKHFWLEDEPTATVYAPLYRIPRGALSFFTNNLSLVVRTATDPRPLATAVRRKIGHADPEVPTSNVQTAEEVLSTSLAARRFNATLLGIFAAATLLLAGLGLYAIIAFSVQQRSREVAIRVALGARPGHLLGSFVGQGLRLVLIVSAVGLCGGACSLPGWSPGFFTASPRRTRRPSRPLPSSWRESRCSPAIFPPAGPRGSTQFSPCDLSRRVDPIRRSQ